MASSPPASPRRRHAAVTGRSVEDGPPAGGRMRDVRLQVGRATLALLAILMLTVVVLAVL